MEYDNAAKNWSNPTTALERAICSRGDINALAAAVMVSRQTVYYWLENGVPLNRIEDVSRATGGKVTEDELLDELREHVRRARA